MERGFSDTPAAMTPDEILDLYDRRRAASRPIANELIRRIGRGAMEDAARRVGLLVRGTLVFDSEAEAAVLSDLCIFDQRTNGENLVEQMLRADPPEAGTVGREMLEAKRGARFSLFAYERTEPGVGVYVRDIFRPEVETFVVDRGMAMSGAPVAMAMRLMFLPDFARTTGAGLPVMSGDAMADGLQALQRRFGDGHAPSGAAVGARVHRSEGAAGARPGPPRRLRRPARPGGSAHARVGGLRAAADGARAGAGRAEGGAQRSVAPAGAGRSSRSVTGREGGARWGVPPAPVGEFADPALRPSAARRPLRRGPEIRR
jgi:hypothetical protein